MIHVFNLTATTHTELIITVNNFSFEQIVFGRNSVTQQSADEKSDFQRGRFMPNIISKNIPIVILSKWEKLINIAR